MKLDDWRQVQASEPATRNQLGAIMREFERLGYQRSRWDRPARLAAAAVLLGLDQFDSLHDLNLGDAGRLLRILQGFRSRAQLETRLYQSVIRADPVPLAVRQNLATLFAWSRLHSSGAAASRP